jgi:hypothetical protein
MVELFKSVVVVLSVACTILCLTRPFIDVDMITFWFLQIRHSESTRRVPDHPHHLHTDGTRFISRFLPSGPSTLSSKPSLPLPQQHLRVQIRLSFSLWLFFRLLCLYWNIDRLIHVHSVFVGVGLCPVYFLRSGRSDPRAFCLDQGG